MFVLLDTHVRDLYQNEHLLSLQLVIIISNKRWFHLTIYSSVAAISVTRDSREALERMLLPVTGLGPHSWGQDGPGMVYIYIYIYIGKNVS